MSAGMLTGRSVVDFLQQANQGFALAGGQLGGGIHFELGDGLARRAVALLGLPREVTGGDLGVLSAPKRREHDEAGQCNSEFVFDAAEVEAIMAKRLTDLWKIC